MISLNIQNKKSKITGSNFNHRCLLILLLFPLLMFSSSLYSIEKIKMRGDHNYPPFEYIDDAGNPAGFNIEIVKAVAEIMNLDISIQLGPWDKARRELEKGEIDALAGMYKTKERDKIVDFSIPHLVVSYAIFVRKNSDIKSLNDVRDRLIIVQKDDLGNDYVRQKQLTHKIIEKGDWEDTLKSLSEGEGDCAIVSRLQGLRLINKLGIKNLKSVGPPIIQRKYCIAVKEGDYKLLAKINEGLSLIKTTGKYEKIYEKWFGIYEKNSLNKKLKYLAGIIFILIVIAGTGFLWSWSLRKSVAVKTRELQESEEKFRIIAEQTRLGIAILQDDTLKFVNQAFADIFQYPMEEMLSWKELPYKEIIHSEDYLMVYNEAQKKQRGDDDSNNNYEYRILSKDGRIKWIETHSKTALYNGQPADLIALTDITEKKITQELLIQTEKMMSIGGLAAGMAHEINNPLGIISHGIQNTMRRLNTEKEDNAKVAEECGTDMESINCYLEKRKIFRYLEGIHSAVDRAAEIISTMLKFSRRSDQNVSSANINLLLEEAIDLASKDFDLKKKFDFKKIRINKKYSSSIPSIKCYKTEIEQVIMNLLKNAAQAMNDNKNGPPPQIIIETSLEEKNIIIKITDNGPGIEKEKLKYVFEPFYTTKPVGTGTGLGLSISYYIITKNHRGDITVNSEPGSGSTFTIRLPLERL